jgi:2,3,4,5-tetrahydropyridine-2,6-dicarboxylate N-succinyltransferase
VTRIAWGAGFATEAEDGTTLDAWYRWLGWGEYGESAPEEADVALAGGERRDSTRRVTIRPIRVTIDVDEPPTSAADVFLRLHLLSHRLAAPRTLNLDGIFGQLATVAWTDLGPVAPAQLDDVRLALRAEGRTLVVRSLDKFPPMTDYVIPGGVRIADPGRVRLGAHLA